VGTMFGRGKPESLPAASVRPWECSNGAGQAQGGCRWLAIFAEGGIPLRPKRRAQYLPGPGPSPAPGGTGGDIRRGACTAFHRFAPFSGVSRRRLSLSEGAISGGRKPARFGRAVLRDVGQSARPEGRTPRSARFDYGRFPRHCGTREGALVASIATAGSGPGPPRWGRAAQASRGRKAYASPPATTRLSVPRVHRRVRRGMTGSSAADHGVPSAKRKQVLLWRGRG